MNFLKQIAASFGMGSETIYFGNKVEVEARGLDKSGPATFETMAYNGGPLMIKGHDVPVIIEMASAVFERPVTKVNRNHVSDREIGHTTKQKLHKGPETFGIEFKGVFSVPGEDSDQIVTAARGGFPWDCSIEAAYPANQARRVGTGEKVQVNGKSWTGPVIVARHAKITGLAILNTGADRQATVAIAAELSVDEFEALHIPDEKSPAQKQIQRLVDAGYTNDYIASLVGKPTEFIEGVYAGEVTPHDSIEKTLRGHIAGALKTGPVVRAEMQRLIDAGIAVSDLAKNLDMDVDHLDSILTGLEANPPKYLVAALQQMPTEKDEEMSAELKKYLEDNGVSSVEELKARLKPVSPEATPPVAEPVIAAAAVPSVQPTDAAQDVVQAMKLAKLNELQRQREIETICAEFSQPEFNTGTEDRPQYVPLLEHAINNEWDARETKMEAMHWKLSQQNSHMGPAIHDSSQHDGTPEIIEASLLMTSGMSTSQMAKHKLFNEDILHEASSLRFRGYRPSSLAYKTIKAAGLSVRPGQLDETYFKTLREAVRRNSYREIQASSGFATNSFVSITNNAANKMLMVAYQEPMSIVPLIFGRKNATDFKLMYTYRVSSSGVLEKVGKDGEIKSGKLVESEYTQKLDTFAKSLTWTRQDIINDDLGVLNETVSELGRMAFRAHEAAAILTITDSNLWDPAQNENVDMTINTNPFGIAGMTASTQDFEARTDADGYPVNIDGGVVLLPATLKVLGMQVKNDTEIRDSGDATARVYSTKNPHAMTFGCESTPWLSNAKANPNDAARASTWYRFSDPAINPALAVAYLNGNDSPTVESSEADFNVLGQSFRCIFDFSFGKTDPRFRQRNLIA